VDKKTLAIYDQDPSNFSEGWLAQPTPVEILKTVKTYFKPGAPTADIGSGSGRDVHWLNENGYPCTGFDASEGLLNFARQKFPQYQFSKTSLPSLKEISADSFQNVLCETVLMHLNECDHQQSIVNLIRILKPGGVATLSWRHPTPTPRDEHGRLYEAVSLEKVLKTASDNGALILDQSTFISSSSAKTITQAVVQKKMQ
jgi:ubiquinone/menaquinone biosynthesis C-methylase UbiE